MKEKRPFVSYMSEDTSGTLVHALHITLLNILTFDANYVKSHYPESYWDENMDTCVRKLATLILEYPGAPLSQKVFDLLFPDFSPSTYLEAHPEIKELIPQWGGLTLEEQENKIKSHLVQEGMHQENRAAADDDDNDVAGDDQGLEAKTHE